MRLLLLALVCATASCTKPPADSLQSYCLYCGKPQRADDECTSVDCQLTFGKIDEMVVQLKQTPHHNISTSPLTVTTRGYNPDLRMPLGPTITVKPGDTLRVSLKNSLAAERFDTSSLHNQYRDFDTTNMHTHGERRGRCGSQGSRPTTRGRRVPPCVRPLCAACGRRT